MNLKQVIDQLIDERGLDRPVLETLVRQSMEAAYLKKYPNVTFAIHYDYATGQLLIEALKEVVPVVQDADKQVSLKKARFLFKDTQPGQTIKVPFEGTIGRVEVMHAKQLLAQKIKAIEATAVYNEFKDRRGEIIHGVFHKAQRGGFVVTLDDGTSAFLPSSHMSPLDRAVIGVSVRCLLFEVSADPLNEYQLILDRSSGDFVRKLMELEIPEIFEKIVQIKKIVRIAGYKSKVLVFSQDDNIDSVGTCVGIGGSRIKPILNEISGEKIDIIAESDSLEQFIKDALKPAHIDRVQMIDDQNARVWVDEEQRSYAIGKGGQNIALASRLVGLNIQLNQKDEQRHSASLPEGVDDTW
ncbi:transcription termination factor NusA [bacterium]|nr:MAG: transcription termination factor NusA [bacterium]QQR61377.1 MAG: transcription termination factor NusA [bacterium]QQR63103.1 MAG: transcription termination factor NusA [bacterium]